MKPGSRVTSPRSMTSAFGGTAPPMDLMRLPSTTMTAFGVTASEVPSNMRAALRTMVFGCWAKTVDAAKRRATAYFLMAEKVARRVGMLGCKDVGMWAGDLPTSQQPQPFLTPGAAEVQLNRNGRVIL